MVHFAAGEPEPSQVGHPIVETAGDADRAQPTDASVRYAPAVAAVMVCAGAYEAAAAVR